MRYVVLVLLSSLLLPGCDKEQDCGCAMPYQIYYLKAKVIQTSDIACGKPVLDFSEDSLRIRTWTNLDNLSYSVINLPASAFVQDKKLYVSINLLKPDEEFVCTAVGISYPHLKVLDAKSRE
ncbi:MAG: hypothetical protein ABUT20_24985 [Bacteroidota bacterium]